MFGSSYVSSDTGGLPLIGHREGRARPIPRLLTPDGPLTCIFLEYNTHTYRPMSASAKLLT